MKKTRYLFFIILSLSFHAYSRPNKKADSLSCHAYKKNQRQEIIPKNVVSVDGERNMSEVLSQLKRRYPRKYNFDTSQGDDFGFAPCYSSQKKSCRV